MPVLPKVVRSTRVKLVKQNLRKDRSKTYQEALMNPPPREVTVTAAPEPVQQRKLVTLDLHGVLDTGPNQTCEPDTVAALFTLSEVRNLEFVVLSYIGANSHNLRQKAQSFVSNLQEEFRRRFGRCPIRELIITDERTGPNGKVPAIKRLGAIAHIDDNYKICQEVIASSDAEACLVTKRRLPWNAPRALYTAGHVTEALFKLFGDPLAADEAPETAASSSSKQR
jgi:hypothetical protein